MDYNLSQYDGLLPESQFYVYECLRKISRRIFLLLFFSCFIHYFL